MIPTPVLIGGATGATGSVAAKPLPEGGLRPPRARSLGPLNPLRQLQGMTAAPPNR
jgi:hypothetical protein